VPGEMVGERVEDPVDVRFIRKGDGTGRRARTESGALSVVGEQPMHVVARMRPSADIAPSRRPSAKRSSGPAQSGPSVRPTCIS